ncbi:MAG: hypothetical protein ACLQBD_18550 [Syntrophobacteraceae bacterium]
MDNIKLMLSVAGLFALFLYVTALRLAGGKCAIRRSTRISRR